MLPGRQRPERAAVAHVPQRPLEPARDVRLLQREGGAVRLKRRHEAEQAPYHAVGDVTRAHRHPALVFSRRPRHLAVRAGARAKDPVRLPERALVQVGRQRAGELQRSGQIAELRQRRDGAARPAVPAAPLTPSVRIA